MVATIRRAAGRGDRADPVSRPVRLFVAVRLPAEIRTRLVEGTRALRDALEGVRWVPEDQLHVTLRFIGDVEAGRVDRVAEAVRLGVRDRRGFSLELTGAGRFPARGAPRVLWVGVGTSPGLIAAHAAVQAALARVDLEGDGRAFRPHVTIGRIRRGTRVGPSLADALQRVRFAATSQVDSVSLVKSSLSSTGAIHEVVADCPLADSGM